MERRGCCSRCSVTNEDPTREPRSALPPCPAARAWSWSSSCQWPTDSAEPLRRPPDRQTEHDACEHSQRQNDPIAADFGRGRAWVIARGDGGRAGWRGDQRVEAHGELRQDPVAHLRDDAAAELRYAPAGPTIRE